MSVDRKPLALRTNYINSDEDTCRLDILQEQFEEEKRRRRREEQAGHPWPHAQNAGDDR